jgi:hypothetical protein
MTKLTIFACLISNEERQLKQIYQFGLTKKVGGYRFPFATVPTITFWFRRPLRSISARFMRGVS